MCVDVHRPNQGSVLAPTASLARTSVPSSPSPTIAPASTTTITASTITNTTTSKNNDNDKANTAVLRLLCYKPRQRQHLAVTWLFLACLTATLTSRAVLAVNFYPFGSTNGDSFTEKSDDGGSGKIILLHTFPYFGRRHDKIFVNNNGVISFLNDLRTYRPENFPLNNTPIIAPYWADVDVMVGGTVWYRQTLDPAILRIAENEVRNYSSAYRKFRASWVFVATWDDVGFYGAVGEGRNRRNTFQAVLVSDGALSFVLLNYQKIEWTTGSNSQGTPETGLGGNPAQAGFNAGDGINYYEIEGARTEGVINLTRKSNVDIPGKFIFRTDAPGIQGSCSAAGSGTLYLQPSSGNMLGGYEVTVTGPCFNTTSVISALVVESNSTLSCVIESEAKARCVMATDVFLIGQVTVAIIVDHRPWNYSGIFTLVNAAQLTLAPQVVRLSPQGWRAHQVVSVSWDPGLLPSTEQVLVELMAFRNNGRYPKFDVIGEPLSAPNSGSAYITMPAFDDTAVAVVQIKAPHAPINGSQLSIWSDVFPVRWRNASRSDEWCGAWLDGESQEGQLQQQWACPCTLGQAERDMGRWQVDPLCSSKSSQKHNCLYRGSNTHECLVPAGSWGTSSASQVCCYDKDRELLDVRDGGGGSMLERFNFRLQTNDTVPWLSYLLEDVVPFLHCCDYGTDRAHCDRHRDLRPPVSCQDYSPPAAAQAAGDPHLVTLDNLNYTFNGEGDFVLLEDVSHRIAVHVHATRAKDIEGNPQNATVFTAVAMAVDNETDVVEIRKDSEDFVLVLVNQQETDVTDSRTELRGMTIYNNGTASNGTVELTVVMDTVGISVLVSVTEDLLNIMVLVSSNELKGKLCGLLGNNNNNKSDDFMARDGSIISIDASMRDIHYQFGMTWLLAENETLLQRPDLSLLSTSSGSATRNEFVPVFINSLSNDTYRNGTDELCEGNIQCVYDFQLTGKESIAESTKAFSDRFLQVVSEIEPVVRCPYVDQISNGNRTVNGQKVGSIAQFHCDDQFHANGSIALECLDSGSWNASLPTCEKMMPSSDFPMLYVGIISGCGAFLLLLLGVGLYFLITCRCRRKKPTEAGSDGEPPIELPVIFTGPDIPNPVFENPQFLTSLQNLKSDGGRFQIPRPRFVDPKIYTEYF